MTTQVFWDLPIDGTQIVSINSTPITAVYIDQFVFDHASEYEVLEDTTNQQVLTVKTYSPVTLGYQTSEGIFSTTSVISDFTGGRPIRTSNPK